MNFYDIKPHVVNVQKLNTENIKSEYKSTPHHIMLYTMNGSADVLVNEQNYRLPRGSVLIIKQRSKWALYKKHSADIICIHYDYSNKKSSDKSLIKDENCFNDELLAGELNHMEDTFVLMLTEFERKKKFSDLYISSCLISVLIEITRKVKNIKNYVYNRNDTKSALLEYIHQNCYRNITVNDLASHFKLNPNYINTLVKKLTGYPVHKYIVIRRISKSIGYLQYSDMPISQIAEAVGYFDISHFTKVFKSIMGKSPQKFRKSKPSSKIACSAPTPLSKEKLQKAFNNAAEIIFRNIIKFQDNLPKCTTTNEIYSYQKNLHPEVTFSRWMSGFWPGLVWLLYEHFGYDYLRCYAERFTCKINDEFKKHNPYDSNTGFIIIPTCGVNYRFTKDSVAKETIILAANTLMTKYNTQNKMICSFRSELDGDTLSCIISNLINSQVFNYAYKLSENVKYYNLAKNDITSVISNHIKESGKTYFRCFYDKTTGKKINTSRNLTYHPDDGTVTRAYAWALYGLATNYSMTKDKFYSDKFSSVFDYLQSHSNSYVIYRDVLGNDDSDTYADVTSSAIIAAALSEFIKNSEITDTKYSIVLTRLINELIDKHSSVSESCAECLLKDGFIKERDNQYVQNMAGDYFYLETLSNLIAKRKSFWYI